MEKIIKYTLSTHYNVHRVEIELEKNRDLKSVASARRNFSKQEAREKIVRRLFHVQSSPFFIQMFMCFKLSACKHIFGMYFLCKILIPNSYVNLLSINLFICIWIKIQKQERYIFLFLDQATDWTKSRFHKIAHSLKIIHRVGFAEKAHCSWACYCFRHKR